MRRYLFIATVAGLTLAADRPSLINELLRFPIQLPAEVRRQPTMPQALPDPGEDASIAALVSYWRSTAAGRQQTRPSEHVIDRLLDWCESSPRDLSSLLPLFQESPPAQDRIKAIYDRNGSDPGFDSVRQFLRLHSRHFREERIAMARQAHDKEYWVQNSEELEALARLDWNVAEPILLEHVRSGLHRTRALALAQLYSVAVRQSSREKAEAYRSSLRAIVEDRSYPGRGRDYAAEALLNTEWDGRLAWHLERFADPTLRDLRDGSLMMAPLCSLGDEPTRMIAVMAGLIGNRNRTVHDAAITCLVAFHLENARRDALEPLLPWLHNPKWSSARDRLRLIQSMDRLDLRESIPGLIAVLGQDDSYDRSYAAEALMHFRSPSAVPALRMALTKEKDPDHRRRIVGGLVACGGVSDAEAAGALEALARLSSSEAGRKLIESSLYSRDAELGVEVSIGLYLSTRETPADRVIQRLLDRADALRKTQPGVATSIGTLLARWNSPVLARDFVRRLKDVGVTAEEVALAMGKRESLVAVSSNELRALAAGHGTSAGIAAALLGDGDAVLASSDEEAHAALFAAARLRQVTLPMDAVGRLITRTKDDARKAGVAYLEAIDTQESRRILNALHAGQGYISGNRSPYDPGHTSFSAFDSHEGALRNQVRAAGGPDRIWALLTAGYWGGAGQVIVQVRGEGGRVFFEPDEARYLVRDLRPDELGRLRQFLTMHQVERLGPLETGASDGMQMEFVDLAREGGYRVFMNNPQMRPDSIHAQLCDLFRGLLNDSGFQMHYRAGQTLREFRVLLSGAGWSQIHALWKPGLSLLALTQGEAQRGRAAGLVVPGEGKMSATIFVSPQGPQTAQEWKRWTGTELAEDATISPTTRWLEGFQPRDGANHRLWALTKGTDRFVVGTWKEKEGLWRVTGQGKSELLLEGNLAHPVLAAKGEWIVVAQTEGNWAKPNCVVRVHLPTKRVHRVSVPVADTLNPVAELPTGDVLLIRARDPEAPGIKPVAGPEKPEYILLDVTTGKWHKSDGEFWPFEQDTLRPPQPGPRPHTIWVARPDFETRSTTIGWFDMDRRRFTPVVALPSTLLDPSAFWVENDAVIAAYGGDLLRFSLPATQ
jgi:hypothetical protein